MNTDKKILVVNNVFVQFRYHPCFMVIILKTLKTMLVLCLLDYHGIKTCASLEVYFHEF